MAAEETDRLASAWCCRTTPSAPAAQLLLCPTIADRAGASRP